MNVEMPIGPRDLNVSYEILETPGILFLGKELIKFLMISVISDKLI